MRLVHVLGIISLACAALPGCARTENFDITVRNDTVAPLTIALTKDGPPFERMWAGPEDLAIESPKADEQHGYVVLPPGREAEVSVAGKFDRGTRGYLRVYRGEPDISGMIAIGPVSPNRLDVPLRPGANRVAIVEENGRLVRQRGVPATAASAEETAAGDSPTTRPASPAAAR